MNERRIILCPIESFKRDALSRVYLSNKFVAQNFEVIIGHPEILLNVILPSTVNAIWLGRFISLSGDTQADRRLFNLLSKTNGSLYYLHDEGAFYHGENYNHSLELLHPEKFLNSSIVKKVFVWGDYQKLHLDNLIKNKVVVSGMYRFDLYKDDLILPNLYHKPYTLVNTRFPEVNLLDGEVGIFDDRMLQHYISNNHSIEYGLEEMFSTWHGISETFSSFVYAIFKLVAYNKDSLFVIRPHPVESPLFYKKVFRFFDNVIIDGDSLLHQQIKNAELLIHNQCTTGIESLIAGIPTINYSPLSINEIIGTNLSGIIVKNHTQLLETYKEVKAKDFKPIKCKEIFKYLKNWDNSFFTSDFILSIFNDQNFYSQFSFFKLYLVWDVNKLKTVFKFGLFAFLRINKKTRQYNPNTLVHYMETLGYKNAMGSRILFNSVLFRKNKE